MAGKFLLLEEAALRLGITVDEVHRLVDRKKLFPLRDGTTLKFKLEEVERAAAEAGEESAVSGLTIDLDIDDGAANPPQAGGSVALADSIALPGDAAGSAATGSPGSRADGSGDLALDLGLDDNDLAPAARAPAANDDLAQTMLGTGEAIGLDSMELDLDSIVGLSAASGLGNAGPAAAEKSGGSGTLAIDLSDVGLPGGSNATGSLAVGSGIDAVSLSGSLTNAGAALSGALDSGLSLEDGDAAVSGIDLGPLDDGGMDEDGATMLAGDVFEAGSLGGGDDESASVVMAEESASGESSFFGTGIDDESSGFTGDIPLGEGLGAADAAASNAGEMAFGDVIPDARFSGWQIFGLVCCALLLLTGGFVMFDLLRTLSSPGELTLSGPLLNPLSGVFGWRQ
jgi:excisionase family DNA binding protein